MNKTELISSVADKAGLSKKDATAAVAAVIDTVTETLSKGDSLALVGFGTFSVKTRAAREGINPLTKAPLSIPETKVPAFKAGSALKEAVK